MPNLEETFERDFDCEQLQELPSGSLSRFYYPGGSSEGGRDGLMVHICPRVGKSWLGIFAFGDLLSKGKTGLYTWPDPKILCIVSRGQGYLVQVNEPSKYELTKIEPVLEVIPVAARRLVVFVNYTELLAYGKSGVVWTTDRLSWDGITVTAVTDKHIEGRAWDPRVEGEVGFKVNLTNGHVEGGSY